MRDIVHQSVKYCARGTIVTHEELPDKLNSLSALENAIKSFADAPMCNGCTDETLIEISNAVAGLEKRNHVRAENCPIISFSGSCCAACLGIIRSLMAEIENKRAESMKEKHTFLGRPDEATNSKVDCKGTRCPRSVRRLKDRRGRSDIVNLNN